MVAVGVLCTGPRSGVRGPTILTISRERRGQSTSTTENQCAPFVGCIVVLCRLAAFPLALLLKQFGNGTQRIIHLLSRFELSCHIRFKHDDVGAFGILRCVLSTHTLAEVIFRAHCVPPFRGSALSLFLHGSFVQHV